MKFQIINPKSGEYIKGFTIMEIVVATTIFAVVASSMMGLFNYTLKINRRTEAFRQATQGMRTFAESLVKQIRNGQISYGINGTSPALENSSVCGAGDVNNRYYTDKENKLRITDTDGADICFYLASASQSYVGANVFSGNHLIMEKNIGNSYAKQTLNPSNFTVENLAFFVRPVCDPYDHCNDASPGVYANNSSPKLQPVVGIFMKVKVSLNTGEQVNFSYQTSVSSNKYDIPAN
ncbi:MAG: type II secretion system protein [Candidatus Doudnabacteria bacterium]|nr:type II secretion system protein [Candidatus Doudnabacteria bacterium]